jgi:ferritin-like metal-binding protein YciE
VTTNNSQTGKTKRTRAKTKKKDGTIETMEDAFIHELSDMLNAEKQLTKALPKMAMAASNPELAKAFETHKKETEQQIQLIEKAVKSAGVKLKREKCDAMEGLITEGKEIIKEVKEGPVRDAMLIAAAQKVEHYEIASYGCLVAAATQLGFSEAAEILEQILDQEKQTDLKLNQIAEQGVNQDASRQDSNQKGTTMNRNRNGGQNRERDDEGRFMSDDDRNGGGRSSYSRSNRDDYEDDRSYSRSRSNRDDYDDDRSYSRSSRDDEDDRSSRGGRNMPERDEDGRFMSDDDRGGRQGGRSNYSSSRRDSYYSDRDYNDNRYSNASNDRDYDDDRSSRRRSSGSQSSGQGRGWFGDSEGHARAGRHSHDNDRSRSSSGRR